MFNISITTADGEVHISQESGGERIVMSNHYSGQEEPTTGEDNSFATPENQDQLNEVWFKSGWDSAVREAMLRFASGTIIDFFNEVGAAGPDLNPSLTEAADKFQEDYGQQDPHHNEPEGTGEDPLTLSDMLKGSEYDPDVIVRRSDSSGEPEEEKNQTWDPDDTGTWTISSEELNSRLDEAYHRGRGDGFKEGKEHAIGAPRHTTRRSLVRMAQEVVGEDTLKQFAAGMGSPTRFDQVFGESVENFVVPLAKRLGWEVAE